MGPPKGSEQPSQDTLYLDKRQDSPVRREPYQDPLHLDMGQDNPVRTPLCLNEAQDSSWWVESGQVRPSKKSPKASQRPQGDETRDHTTHQDIRDL